jgi:Domain of unknown function (DUF6946)
MAPAFDLSSRQGKEITDVRSWGRHAKPASAKHWKKDRSAMELARSWTDAHGPEAVRELLDRVTGTANFEAKRGIAEAQTHFDEFRGPRNHDLLIVGEAAGGTTVVSIEGKVDESFGQTLEEYRAAARRRIAKKQPTNALDRMQGLTKAIGGWDAGADPKRMQLRYQLFSAVAGAVAAAVDEEADQAVFLVHELQTKQLNEKKAKQNDEELRQFLYVVFGEVVTGDDPSWLIGPLKLAGGSERIPKTMPLYVGKLSTPPAD